MTTTVKVTAHNHMAIVRVESGYEDESYRTSTVSEYKMKDGQSREFTVTDTTTVEVWEQPHFQGVPAASGPPYPGANPPKVIQDTAQHSDKYDPNARTSARANAG